LNRPRYKNQKVRFEGTCTLIWNDLMCNLLCSANYHNFQFFYWYSDDVMECRHNLVATNKILTMKSLNIKVHCGKMKMMSIVSKLDLGCADVWEKETAKPISFYLLRCNACVIRRKKISKCWLMHFYFK